MSAEENKALVRRFFEEFWDQKNLAAADELLAANHVDHTVLDPKSWTQFQVNLVNR